MLVDLAALVRTATSLGRSSLLLIACVAALAVGSRAGATTVTEPVCLDPEAYTSLGTFDFSTNVFVDTLLGNMYSGNFPGLGSSSLLFHSDVTDSGYAVFTFDSVRLRNSGGSPGIYIRGSNDFALLSRSSATFDGGTAINFSGNWSGRSGSGGSVQVGAVAALTVNGSIDASGRAGTNGSSGADGDYGNKGADGLAGGAGGIGGPAYFENGRPVGAPVDVVGVYSGGGGGFVNDVNGLGFAKGGNGGAASIEFIAPTAGSITGAGGDGGSGYLTYNDIDGYSASYGGGGGGAGGQHGRDGERGEDGQKGADGSNGDDGGSAGNVVLHASSVTVSGSLFAYGNSGGSGGYGGNGGWGGAGGNGGGGGAGGDGGYGLSLFGGDDDLGGGGNGGNGGDGGDGGNGGNGGNGANGGNGGNGGLVFIRYSDSFLNTGSVDISYGLGGGYGGGGDEGFGAGGGYGGGGGDAGNGSPSLPASPGLAGENKWFSLTGGGSAGSKGIDGIAGTDGVVGQFQTLKVQAVPEPSTWVMLASAVGMGGVQVLRRSRRSRAAR